jgi:hypothetical protein
MAARTRIHDNIPQGGDALHSIIVIIVYFGRWPEWFPIFLESCRWNPTITWLLHSDCPYTFPRISNVKYEHVTRLVYRERVNKRLRINVRVTNPYKLCDLRPAYGILYEDEISGYDFFGYGDLDVLYGNIRHFYTDAILDCHDVLSVHNWCISGHFALIRNTPTLANLFREIPNWQGLLEDPTPQRFDEDAFIRAFLPAAGYISRQHGAKCDFSTRQQRLTPYLREQFTTPLTPMPWADGTLEHPEEWYWKKGRLTNSKNGSREFIYLHFMNYLNARHMSAAYGKEAFWRDLPQIVHVRPDDINNGIVVNRKGISSAAQPKVPGAV